MDKVQAIKRISEAKESDDIVVATFPSNICDICHKPKNVLFVKFFADILLEACGGCTIKLQALEEILDDLLPEQIDLLMSRMR